MAVPSDPAAALLMRQVTFNPPQGGGTQVNTGPSVPVNSNPVSGGLNVAASPINPGAVGYGDKAQPYSVAPQTQITNGSILSPAVPLPAANQEQIQYGNSIINRGMPQWSAGGESGLVTAKQG